MANTYIQRQPEDQRTKTFAEEYRAIRNDIGSHLMSDSGLVEISRHSATRAHCDAHPRAEARG